MVENRHTRSGSVSMVFRTRRSKLHPGSQGLTWLLGESVLKLLAQEGSSTWLRHREAV
jgi:hypothetical protein